jgi:hypothetical protein
MEKSMVFLITSDIGGQVKLIDLFNLFLKFEEAGYNIDVIRGLKKLCYSSFEDFIELIESKKKLHKYIRDNFPKRDKDLGYNNKYRVIKKKCKAYSSFVRYLKKFGEVGYDLSKTVGGYSPFYSLGRELPIFIKLKLNENQSNLSDYDFYLSIYSNGIIISKLFLDGKQKVINLGGNDKVFELIKEEISRIKFNFLLKLEIKYPDYAYYYWDRNIVTHYKSKNLLLKQDDYLGIHNSNDFVIGINSLDTTIVHKSTNRNIKMVNDELISVFELGLIQRYFLNTRDSYIDKSIRLFKSSSSRNTIEKKLLEQVDISREVHFIKDEGGIYKIFNNPIFSKLYYSISKYYNLSEISSNFEIKSNSALGFTNATSSLKRERLTANLSLIMLALNIIIIIDIIIRLWKS